ncbi:MAG TPA: hypothetical protein VJS88_08845 [Chthoniobacterales bacterium]|nr:hypothetical protein [Chthoniobacterales bacterium]
MNGQPPPPPPAVPPIQPAAAPVYYPPPQSGTGCCAKGCLTMLIAGFLLCILVAGAGWFFYKTTFNKLTSSAPSDVRIEAPTPDQIQTAQTSLDRLNTAIARQQETTVAFTGPELRVLLARESDLDFLRDRSRIDISNSIMTVTLSAPLDALPWPGVKGRWFNGTVRFGMTYTADAGFHIDLKSIEANDFEFPHAFLSRFNSSFNNSMNEGFQDELRRNNRGNDFWNHVKSITLEGDKAIVTTKGGGERL